METKTTNWVNGSEKFEFEYQGLIIGHRRFYGSWLSDDLDAYDRFREWVYKSEKFFSLAEITDERKKLYFAGVRGLAGSARQWFVWTQGERGINSWEELKLGLKNRFFSPRLLYEKSLLEIISIVQTGNIDDYYWKFFRLRHNLDLSERALTCLFSRGLKRWLRAETMDMMVGKEEPAVDDLWKRCRELEDGPKDRIERVFEAELVLHKEVQREEFDLALVMSSGVTVKFDKLEKFAGSSAPDDLEDFCKLREWIVHMENFFAIANLVEEKKKLLESSKSLAGDARHWFAWRLTQAKEGLPEHGINSWEDLKAGLKQQFFSERLLYKKSLLRIIALEQTECVQQSIDHYYDEFVMLKGHLDLSERALTWIFFKGLRPPLKAKMEETVISGREPTLDYLWQRGRVLENMMCRARSTYGTFDD